MSWRYEGEILSQTNDKVYLELWEDPRDGGRRVQLYHPNFHSSLYFERNGDLALELIGLVPLSGEPFQVIRVEDVSLRSALSNMGIDPSHPIWPK